MNKIKIPDGYRKMKVGEICDDETYWTENGLDLEQALSASFAKRKLKPGHRVNGYPAGLVFLKKK